MHAASTAFDDNAMTEDAVVSEFPMRGSAGVVALELGATPTPSTPGTNGAGVLNQRYVETSNVNVAEELVLMIQTQRAYELNSRAISTSDNMLGKLTSL